MDNNEHKAKFYINAGFVALICHFPETTLEDCISILDEEINKSDNSLQGIIVLPYGAKNYLYPEKLEHAADFGILVLVSPLDNIVIGTEQILAKMVKEQLLHDLNTERFFNSHSPPK